MLVVVVMLYNATSYIKSIPNIAFHRQRMAWHFLACIDYFMHTYDNVEMHNFSRNSASIVAHVIVKF